MITQRAVNYAKVLYSLDLDESIIQDAKNIFMENAELTDVFENPVIEKGQKEKIIDTVFDKQICRFLKVLNENKCMDIAIDIFTAYEKIMLEKKDIVKAKLAYAVKPNDEELEQIKAIVCQKYKKAGVSLELIEDASLIGGYVLTVEDTEFDKSIKGTLCELQKTLGGR